MENINTPPLANSASPKNHTMLKVVSLILGALLFLYIGGLVGYFVGSNNSASIDLPSESFNEEFLPLGDNEQVVCTMDAKICPDGSSVGRVGPNCEFAECPVSDDIQMELELQTPEGDVTE